MSIARNRTSPTIVYIASGRNHEIMTFALETATGRLEQIGRVALPGTVTPLAISPSRRYLFAGLRSDPPAIASFAIDAHGLLSPRGHTPLTDAPMHMATDARGDYLLSASYAAASFTINRISDDGCVDATARQHTRTPPRAHSVLVDPTNRFLFVAALGGDMILPYDFAEATGRATPNAVRFVALARGSGPRHMVFHPSGKLLYVNGELDGSVVSLALDHATGRLRRRDVASIRIPASLQPAWAAEIVVNPDGRYLYASERKTSTVTTFALDTSGTIRNAATIATETQPRAMAIDPAGRWLLVAGETSDHLTVYAIDRATGALRPHQRYAVAPKPVWIATVALAARVDAAR
jgi:6-phosphogluconolactonase